jgi:predicted AlkP superfamily phosphohydrolase/phosphomutase
MQQGPRVVIVGLDCVPPKLLFDDLNAEVPTIAKLMGEGMHGDLASITPPITVPAWACAMTGKVPGQLGIYGFRNRKDATYDGLAIAHSGSVKEPAVWDKLGEGGMRSVLIGVPPGFPPPKEFPGWRVACFLTPPSAERWAYPQELEVEIEEELGKGEYIFDIPNFREAGFDMALDQVFKMTQRRFQVGRRLIKNKPWDFFFLCDIGPDRLHHVFWQYYDPRHPLYEPGNKFETTFQDYYRFMDREIASFLELVPDDAVTIVMSDHGARPMMGGLCFNDR